MANRGDFKDEAGNRYGKIKVVKFGGRNKHGQVLWECACDCGNVSYPTGCRLRRGLVKSCGCTVRKPRLPKGQPAFNRAFDGMKRSAKKRNHEWKLTKEQVIELVDKDCFYCGAPPSNIAKPPGNSKGTYAYNGIDRVDNNKGYLITNVVTSCFFCNRAKQDKSVPDFFNWIRQIASNLDL